MTELRLEIYEMIKEWCDGLLAYQIREIEDPSLKGGLLCPACSIIHGRCNNAIPAMLFLAEREGEEKYIRCAEGLIDWSGQLLCPDGGFVNDTQSQWKGTTVFAFLSLCDAYFDYGHMLDEAYRDKLYGQMCASLKYLTDVFDCRSGNINYMMATAYALEKAGVCFENPEYRERAAVIYEEFSAYFTENDLIYGEGAHEWNAVSKKGCRPVDIGYSVEEILNHMVLYGISSGNEAVLEQAGRTAESCLSFFLPDGGLDNSFGTRLDKWTYWGSRTSDGCQPAFFILGKRNPALARAAYRNLQCMKRCTQGGLLCGGRDLRKRGEAPCIHHSFTHVNGLLTAYRWLEENELPVSWREEGKDMFYGGSRYFPELDLYLHDKDGFRATITASDLLSEKENCTPRSGALSLLFHKDAGILCAASMTVYNRFELQNTQRHREDTDTPLTPRLEYRRGKELYSSIQDRQARLEKRSGDRYFCRGYICDEAGAHPFEEKIEYTVQYDFSEKELCITYTHTDAQERLDFHFPLITEEGVSLECSALLERREKRIFNHVPGFEAADYFIRNAPRRFTLRLRIQGDTGRGQE